MAFHTLMDACFDGADLLCANLKGTNLRYGDLGGAKLSRDSLNGKYTRCIRPCPRRSGNRTSPYWTA